jgi:hypothetical protein
VTRHPSALTISKTVYNSLPQLFSPSHADSLPSLMIGAAEAKVHGAIEEIGGQAFDWAYP